MRSPFRPDSKRLFAALVGFILLAAQAQMIAAPVFVPAAGAERALVVAHRFLSPDPVLRRAALRELKTFGLPERRRTFSALLSAYGRAHKPARLRVFYAAQWLGARVPAVVPFLAARANDRDAEIRMAALDALGWIGPRAASALPVVMARLNDPRPEVRVDALFAAEGFGFRARAALPLILARFADDDETVRASAAQVFATFVAQKWAGPELIQAFASPDRRVRCGAAFACYVVGPPADAYAGLLFHALTDPDAAVREYAAAALKRLPSGPSAATLSGSAPAPVRKAASAI